MSVITLKKAQYLAIALAVVEAVTMLWVSSLLALVVAIVVAVIATIAWALFPEKSDKEDAVNHLLLSVCVSILIVAGGNPAVVVNGAIQTDAMIALITILFAPAAVLEGYLEKRRPK